MSWLIGGGVIAFLTATFGVNGILYLVFAYIPMMLLNAMYSIFTFIGSGFSSIIFSTQVIGGKLVWQFTWGGTLFTIVVSILIICAISWVILLLWKMHQQNALKKFGNNGTPSEHVKWGLGLLLFLFISPFLMMIFSSLTSILISIFNINQASTLSLEQITALKTVGATNLNNLLGLLNLGFSESSSGLINSLTDLQTQLNQLISDASNHGRTDIVNLATNALNEINNLIPYLSSGFSSDISQIISYFNQLQAGTININLANEISSLVLNLQQAQGWFSDLNQYLSALNVNGYQTVINQWGDYSTLWTMLDRFSSSWVGTTTSDIGYYLNSSLTDTTCLLNQIVYGTDNVIGLTDLNFLLTGEANFNLVQELYYVMTAGTSKNFYDIWAVDNASLSTMVVAILLVWISLGTMIGGTFQVAKCWTMILINWFGVLFVFAKGDELGVKRYNQNMFSLFVELLFVYVFAEIILLIIPEIIDAWTSSGSFNYIAAGAGIVFIDAGLASAFFFSGRLARSLVAGENIDYYTRNPGTTRQMESVGRGGSTYIKTTASVGGKAVKGIASSVK